MEIHSPAGLPSTLQHADSFHGHVRSSSGDNRVSFRRDVLYRLSQPTLIKRLIGGRVTETANQRRLQAGTRITIGHNLS